MNLLEREMVCALNPYKSIVLSLGIGKPSRLRFALFPYRIQTYGSVVVDSLFCRSHCLWESVFGPSFVIQCLIIVMGKRELVALL